MAWLFILLTQKCVSGHYGGIFWCWTHLNYCQESSMCPSCVYMCLNIYNPMLCHTLFCLTMLCSYRIKNKSNCTMLCNTLLHFHNRVIILISPCFVILDLDCFDWVMVTSFYLSADLYSIMFIISYTRRPIGRKFSKC